MPSCGRRPILAEVRKLSAVLSAHEASCMDSTTREPANPDDDESSAPDQGGGAALQEPALHAALLALGLGVIWAVLSRGRRRRPTDLW